jgi:hypothetical protein
MNPSVNVNGISTGCVSALAGQAKSTQNRQIKRRESLGIGDWFKSHTILAPQVPNTAETRAGDTNFDSVFE